MPIPRTEFVQKVWDALGATGKTDFARKLGLGPDGLQKVRRWQAGGRLDYDDVMAMLERTGWFVMDASGVQSSDPSGAEDRERLAENDASILANQKEAMKLLKEIRAAVVSQAEAAHSAATHPRRRRA